MLHGVDPVGNEGAGEQACTLTLWQSKSRAFLNYSGNGWLASADDKVQLGFSQCF